MKDQKNLLTEIWKILVIPEYGSDKSAKDSGVFPEKIAIGITDLNDDGKNDALVLISKEYCGSDGCTINAILSNPKNSKIIDICQSIKLSTPIYLMENKTNGLHDLSVNAGKTLKYNSKSYCW